MKNIFYNAKTNIKDIGVLNKATVLLSLSALYVAMLLTGCKKMIELDFIQNKTQAELVFVDAGSSNSAINGIYRQAKDSFYAQISIYNGLVSDDLALTAPNATYDPYLKNQITPNLSSWANYYKVIYACNAAIEGLQNNNSIDLTVKNQYIGEAKFNRAWCYFYLVNLFGDVPLITSSDVQLSATAPRSATSAVYKQIVLDLTDAQSNMQADYTFNGMGKARANKWAAAALLARVYLYLNDYVNAEKTATDVIGSGLYSLLPAPNGLYLKDNNEAILQWANNTGESNELAKNAPLNPPTYVVSTWLLNAFETGDLRRTTWIGSKIVNGQTVSYPFKFTDATTTTNERYTVLRLAEQYLIRAEARVFQNNFSGAIADVNLIRSKHGGLIIGLPIPNTQSACIDLILKERQVDLFTEGMHRWFDLKRLKRLDAILTTEKPATWKSYAALYPVPLTDLQRNPNLTQNTGY